MKPYGREKKLKFPGKRDWNIRENGKKVLNWWEDPDTTIIPRTTIKANVKKEIFEEIENGEII